MKNQFVFFLGGHGLEMETISEIWQEQGCELIDHHLIGMLRQINCKRNEDFRID